VCGGRGEGARGGRWGGPGAVMHIVYVAMNQVRSNARRRSPKGLLSAQLPGHGERWCLQRRKVIPLALLDCTIAFGLA
jgi:hypothetical protein